MNHEHTMKHILITGGCGFIGTNFVRFVLNQFPEIKITNLDLLTYAGQRDNLAQFESDSRYQFVHGDICDFELLTQLLPACDTIIHMAAESHVDRSLKDATPFIRTNIVGTQTLLDAMRHVDPQNQKRLIYVSTDEVYGELPLNGDEKFHEDWPLAPRSPYAASKASADLLVQSYHHTYHLQAIISRCSNNFGPYQYPEKLIPLFVTNILQNKKVPLYGNGLNVRDWIFVEDHVQALCHLAKHAQAGSVYNIGANCEYSNLDLTLKIMQFMNADTKLINYVQDRLGHDKRYALCTDKIRNELNWKADNTHFDQQLNATIDWYKQQKNWWQPLKKI